MRVNPPHGENFMRCRRGEGSVRSVKGCKPERVRAAASKDRR